MEHVQQMQQVLSLQTGQGGLRESGTARDVGELQSIFIRNASHEFRTPLSIIQGYVELLHGGDLGALQPEQEQALSIVVNRVRELQRVIDRLGILMAAETRSAVPMPVDLAEMVARVVEARRADADRSDIELVTCLEPDLPPMSGDLYQLEQVVESLVENALKFTLAGGRVEVDVHAEPDWVCLAVTDTGIGIPEQELTRIFSGFYQADGSTTRRYGGLGLGLTLVKAVVENHAGQIEVESQPGQGSRFAIRLPAVQDGGHADWPVEEAIAMRNAPAVGNWEYVTLPQSNQAPERLPDREALSRSTLSRRQSGLKGGFSMCYSLR